MTAAIFLGVDLRMVMLLVCGPRLSTGIVVLNRLNDASTIHLPLHVVTIVRSESLESEIDTSTFIGSAVNVWPMRAQQFDQSQRVCIEINICA